MPSRNTIRAFEPYSTVHVYNRGVNKSNIFNDSQDYQAFLRRLQLMLLPSDDADSLQTTQNRIRVLNFHDKIKLQAYCLMPNHFHMLLHLGDEPKQLSDFMKTLSTSYSMYFNLKHDRVGPLFQGKFKAAVVDSDVYKMHLIRYIHANPKNLTDDIFTYKFSSLQYFFDANSPDWLSTDEVEQLFNDQAQHNQFTNDLINPEQIADQYQL